MSDTNQRTALVTGANKGIGLEIARQLGQAGIKVLVGARDASRGQAAADTLASEGLVSSFIHLDVVDPSTVSAASKQIEEALGHLDILVNNAGINVRGDGAPSCVDLEAVRATFETNYFGALRVTQAMLPLLRKATAGRIVNISSSLGSLALNNDPAYPGYEVRFAGYNASKAALNMLTIQLNAELRDTAITAISVCPGLTKTDLSGHMGNRLPEEAAKTPVRLALQTIQNALGLYQDEAGSLPW